MPAPCSRAKLNACRDIYLANDGMTLEDAAARAGISKATAGRVSKREGWAEQRNASRAVIASVSRAAVLEADRVIEDAKRSGLEEGLRIVDEIAVKASALVRRPVELLQRMAGQMDGARERGLAHVVNALERNNTDALCEKYGPQYALAATKAMADGEISILKDLAARPDTGSGDDSADAVEAARRSEIMARVMARAQAAGI